MVAQIDAAYLHSAPRRVLPRLLSYALFEGRPLTTRGRWINPLVFAQFALLQRLPFRPRVDRPLFIVGTGRSGTTALGVTLSLHGGVGFLNEPKALWHVIYPHEDVVGNYTREPARYRLDAGDASDATVTAAHRLFGAYLAVTGQRRLLDKYPELVFRVPFVRRIFPDARFLFVVRNGWDACASIEAWSQRKGERRGAELHDWWGADGRKWTLMREELVKNDMSLAALHPVIDQLSDHRHMAVVEWIVTMREGLRQQALAPGCVLTVRYETLAADPEPALREILDFAGLDHDARLIAYARETLRPRPPHPRFELPDALAPEFERTMRMLGYGPA
jgi:hypothetical protein